MMTSKRRKTIKPLPSGASRLIQAITALAEVRVDEGPWQEAATDASTKEQSVHRKVMISLPRALPV